MIVDAHHHVWDPSRGDYGWIPPGDPVLDRAYHIEDFLHASEGSGVTHSVLVQAAPSTAETEYLLDLASDSPRIAAVVGWIDFNDPAQRRMLDKFAAHPKFRSVRPMVQDIADDDWILSPHISWAFDAVQEMDLAFDALGFTRHGSRFLALLRDRPTLRLVIDHCLKPPIAMGRFDDWAKIMQEIACSTSACCKLSGLSTEARSNVDATTLRPWTAHVLQWFGARRVMWGSDWPVSRLRHEYKATFDMARTGCSELSAEAQEAIFAGTAARFYRIAVEDPS